jgi:hypothetical protein
VTVFRDRASAMQWLTGGGSPDGEPANGNVTPR